MNCRRIEKLIPLYVEGDLDAGHSDKVRSHAKSCSDCSGLIAEYKESQRWLRSFAPPRFDDALLNDLKRGVLEKINEPEAGASFLNRLIGDWTQRLVLASSAVALLIVLGSIAFYVYQDNGNDIAAQEDVEQEEQSPEIASRQEDVKQALGASSGLKRRRHIAKRRANPGHAVERPDKTLAAPAVAIESGDNADSKEMLRIEIQTSDPNIRIIWFSPKESDSNPSRPITEAE